MRKLSVSDIMIEGPCPDYPRERVVKLWAGRKRLSLLEICALRIPGKDRVWAAEYCLNKRELLKFENMPSKQCTWRNYTRRDLADMRMIARGEV